MVRMTPEEMGFRPVPLLASIESATPEAIAALPSINQSGPFFAFTLTGAQDQQWVVSAGKQHLACERQGTGTPLPLLQCPGAW